MSTWRVVFPTYRRGLNSNHPLLKRYVLDNFEMSLLKVNGSWTPVISPSLYAIEDADGFYQGGRTYLIDDTAAADLPAQYKEFVS